ncbi:TVP38/TMEM64 family protein [Cohnella nanjingensis]|uniref:TVP38/TMEM64 family membrane protein n=1 Tax=Cohnella nanjingensis TaxID=1387779 RepID=A0A7X0VCZ2_9BACL|nr:TVP38/TMEM64 family protein [Cohnella nanjingensis]
MDAACNPGVPFGVVGGIIGAKYGTIWGSVMNVSASTIGSAVAYILFRYLFHAWGKSFLAKSAQLHRLNRTIGRHLFRSILLARIIPVIPAALINLYAGVFAIPF